MAIPTSGKNCLECAWWVPGSVRESGRDRFRGGTCTVTVKHFSPYVDAGCSFHEPLDSAHAKAERQVALTLFNIPKGAYGQKGRGL